MQPLLVDFGISRELDQLATHVKSRAMGTYGYQAPEVSMMRYSPKTDIFALGVIILQMATGRYVKVSLLIPC